MQPTESARRDRHQPRRSAAVRRLAILALPLACGCSMNRMVSNKFADALSGTGTTFSADDDPDLVGAAVPFSLKLMESVLASTPNHKGLLLAAASGFTGYAYGWVEQEADFVADSNFTRATALRQRAKRLYLRARNYGLRGLDVAHPGFSERLRADPRAAVAMARKEDVALLYWTAAAWGAAIGLSKDTPEAVADVPLMEALIDRASALDPDFGDGSIHSFLITYEMARQGATGDPTARARAHFDRAVELTHGLSASPFVSFAEAVDIGSQNKAEFEAMLQRALAVDVNARPEWRVQNLITQRRAQWLLSRTPDLFLDAVPADSGGTRLEMQWR